ncbi:MAG: peptidylprolyl isomerase [Paracoccaceae bacterium]
MIQTINAATKDAATKPFRAQSASGPRRQFLQTRARSFGKRCAAMARLAALVLALALAVTLPARQAQAQNLFSPVAFVNDRAITGFELEQRMAFMQALSSAGDLEKLALDALTNERIQAQTAKRMGLAVTPEELTIGMEEFAARGGLSLEDFAGFLEQNNVAQETFRDFVSVGLLWRKVVQAKFGALTSVSDKDLRFAIAPSAQRSGVRLLFSEIFLPVRNAAEQNRATALANKIAATTSLNQFAAYARQYSAAPTGRAGGRVNWVDAADLPPQLAAALSALQIGQVAGPLNAGNALALFQLRAIEETGAAAPKDVSIEYAAYYIAGGRSEPGLKRAAQLRAKVKTCNDLYGIAKGEPESTLERGTKSVAEIPQDIAIELAKLDVNEISTALTRANGQTLVFLMLCNRTHLSEEDQLDPGTVSEGIFNQRLSAQADLYLAELRANANIRLP